MNIHPILLVFLALALGVAVFLPHFRKVFVIRDGTVGLLFRHGRHVATLPAGRHTRWGRGNELRAVDVRAVQHYVPGQEVLTADHVQIKLSVMLSVRIVDPARAILQFDNHIAHLHSAVQAAVRSAIGAVGLEELLGRRFALAEGLLANLAPTAAKLGLELANLELRDVMLPAELRKAYAEVLRARQEGQAALERARGESAALRNLANAARLLETQPALATLRLLQTLESGAVQPTVVLPGLLTALGQVRPAAEPDPG